MTDHPSTTDWQNRCERAEAECKELRAEVADLKREVQLWRTTAADYADTIEGI